MKKKVLIGLAIVALLALLACCILGMGIGIGQGDMPTRTPTKTPTHWPTLTLLPTSTLVATASPTPTSAMTPGATPRPKKAWPTAIATPEVTLDECIAYILLEVYLEDLKVQEEAVILADTCLQNGLGNKKQCADLVAEILYGLAEQECIELGYR